MASEPARSGSSKSASSGKREGEQGASEEDRSLKEREYRDAEGKIHHHTRTYEEQHGRKG